MTEKSGYSNGNFKRQGVVSWVVISILLGLVLTTAYATYLAAVPLPTFSYVQQPFPIQEKVVRVGETVHMDLETCRIRMSPTVTEISFKSSRGSLIHILTNEHEGISLGCNTSTVSYVVPESLATGTYRLVFDVRSQPNQFRTERYRYESEEFEVLPAEGKGG